jgi:CDP-diacylglycerol---serine O-phosphatidyltransferase
LPNLFTSASLFSGFYSIVASIHGRFEAAAVAIIISAVLDGLDGRIARLTNTTTQFGVEYDSLADVIAFGVAPGILAFQWALEPFGRLGWLAAFMFVICGALRLARFNVQKTNEDASYFKGLPIPAAASFIAAMILFVESWDGSMQIRSALIIAMIYILVLSHGEHPSLLQLQEIRHTEQEAFQRAPVHHPGFLIIAYKPKIMLFLILSAYVASGPVVTFYRLFRRIPFKKASKTGAGELEVREEATTRSSDF